MTTSWFDVRRVPQSVLEMTAAAVNANRQGATEFLHNLSCDADLVVSYMRRPNSGVSPGTVPNASSASIGIASTYARRFGENPSETRCRVAVTGRCRDHRRAGRERRAGCVGGAWTVTRDDRAHPVSCAESPLFPPVLDGSWSRTAQCGRSTSRSRRHARTATRPPGLHRGPSDPRP